MAKTKRMFMGGAAKAAMQSVKSAPKTGPAKPGMPPPQSMPPRGMPPRGMPPRGDTGTNVQKIDYAAQNAAGPGQMQFMSDKLRGNPGMPPTVSGAQAKGMGLGQAMGGNPQMAQNLGKVAGAAMGGMGMKSGGTASSRADGCATKGKTKGRFV